MYILDLFFHHITYLPISPLYFIESLYHINANIQRICDSFSDMEKIHLLVETMFENQACLFTLILLFIQMNYFSESKVSALQI